VVRARDAFYVVMADYFQKHCGGKLYSAIAALTNIAFPGKEVDTNDVIYALRRRHRILKPKKGALTAPTAFSRERLIVTASDNRRQFMSILQNSETGAPQSRQSDLDRVISFAEWCRRISVSAATGRRILASDEGPAVTRSSARRLGIRERDHLAWLDARREAAA
jgi:hypothetical protein